MFTLICENSRGQQLNLTRNNEYIVTRVDGLTPSNASINTTKVALGDGAIYNSSVVNERNIVITLYISGNIERNRQRLYSIFKTKELCRIYFKNQYRSVYIDGYVESFEATIFDKQQKVQISILCPSPYFVNVNQHEYDFSWTASGIQFPISIPAEGIEFGTIENISSVNVINNGDVDTGVKIVITARGTVLNPTIINTQTNERMKINYSMQAGDTITITTYRGEKHIRLTHNGVTTNILRALDTTSTWFKVYVGDNPFAYESSTGGGNLDIKFIFSELYEGV